MALVKACKKGGHSQSLYDLSPDLISLMFTDDGEVEADEVEAAWAAAAWAAAASPAAPAML